MSTTTGHEQGHDQGHGAGQTSLAGQSSLGGQPHAGDEAHGPSEGHGALHSDRMYVQIAILLAILTGLEVALSYIDVGPLFLPLLLILMVIKFFMVVLFFMHLKFDSPLFSFFFYAGLALAVGCYVAALATFKFFL